MVFMTKLVFTALGLFIVFAMLYPVMVAALSSLVRTQLIVSSIGEIAEYGVSLDHYIKAVEDPRFLNGLANSILVALLNIAVSVAVITPAAYAFSRFDFRGRDLTLIVYLILSQIGGGFGVAALIALYVFLIRLNMIGLPVIGNPLILPIIYTAGAVPFQTWMIKNYFDSLPRSLDEAALIDGASWFDVVFRVILPASKPAMIITALFAFMGAWGEFIMANFLRVSTLAAYIYETATAQVIYWSDFAARVILFAIPIILVYALSQRYIGEAMRYGAGRV